ncbi:cytochrome-c peroxidase [Rubinisphaera sp. JC750]|uniref:cytochrome-c peroxidase n=1 Tax=Rubinisphaera sp. JC750 TaxID=2898658 RepID=UPI001F41A26C|nr:cytochrome c peroxidase [Rubinisphaera sp. JC750]
MCVRFTLSLCLSVSFSLLSVSAAQAQELSPIDASLIEQQDSPEMIELGKKLFFDPRLSRTGTISCNSCHNAMEGGDDGRVTSMGVDGLLGGRNAPTVWNSALQGSQFWDGRAATLELQAMGPMVADVEMGMAGHDQVMERIAGIPGYVQEFQKVFGKNARIDLDEAITAIAAYERTLITPNSPLDRHLQGDKQALTDIQKQGLQLFESIGCTECHSGPAMNGWNPEDKEPVFEEFPRFDDVAAVEKYDLASDTGRQQVTGKQEDAHYFKVPTLRNIALTAPYMHNGQVPTLEEAVRVMASAQLATELTDEETNALVQFLYATEGEFPSQTMPRLPSRAGQSIVPVAAEPAVQAKPLDH